MSTRVSYSMTISKKNKHHAKPPKSKPRLDTQVSAILDVPQTEKRERKLTLNCYALRRTPHRMPRTGISPHRPLISTPMKKINKTQKHQQWREASIRTHRGAQRKRGKGGSPWPRSVILQTTRECCHIEILAHPRWSAHQWEKIRQNPEHFSNGGGLRLDSQRQIMCMCTVH